MSFAEKAKIVDRGWLCSAPESTGSKLQHEPYLFSVSVLLDQVIHLGKNLGELVKGLPRTKLKSLFLFPYVTRLNLQVVSLNMILMNSR